MADMDCVSDLADSVRKNINKVIVGKENEIDFLIIAFLCGGHVLIEDVPGTGKTMLVKSFAVSLGCGFKRIQFTPDLLPSDITGIKYFNMKKSEFEFIPGPVFSNIVLADEINRATPKTQSGLLECMEERQVTIEGETYGLPLPFMVAATQNPIESMGVFPLPEAQLDRFLLKIDTGYPTSEESNNILRRFDKADPLLDLKPVVSENLIAEARKQVNGVYVHKDLYQYITDIAELTRNNDNITLGISPRGCLALLRTAKGLAAVKGRDYVIPDDIKRSAAQSLAHRLILKTTLSFKKNAASNLIREILGTAAVPTEDIENYKLP